MDAKTKLVPSWRIGKRDPEVAFGLMADLQERITGRPQITTDGFKPYFGAVHTAFGNNVDFAQLVKVVKEVGTHPRHREGYAPATVVKCYPTPMIGKPKRQDISTSLIERQNLTIRMSMRRLTRLTNAFSKKLDNLKAAVALHFAYYNLCRVHKTLRMTPAMAAGVCNTIWGVDELLLN